MNNFNKTKYHVILAINISSRPYKYIKPQWINSSPAEKRLECHILAEKRVDPTHTIVVFSLLGSWPILVCMAGNWHMVYQCFGFPYVSAVFQKYHSLLTVVDGVLLAAVAPSIIVQLVCSIYISPVSFGIFGSSSCVGRFLSVHCDLVCVRVSFVDFNCYRFDSSLQVLLGCHVMLQACLWVQVAGQAA